MAGSGWVYNQSLHRYQNAETGKVLDTTEVRLLRDQFVDALKVISKALAHRYTTGAIPLSAFGKGLQEVSSVVVTGGFMLGRGGLNAMTAADWNTVAARIAVNEGYLVNWLNGDDPNTPPPVPAARKAPENKQDTSRNAPLGADTASQLMPPGQTPTGVDVYRGEYDVTPGDWVDYLEDPDFDDLKDNLGIDEDDDLSDLNYDYEDDFDNEMGDYEPFAQGDSLQAQIENEAQDRKPDEGESTDENEYKTPEERKAEQDEADEELLGEEEFDAGLLGEGEKEYRREHPFLKDSETEAPGDVSDTGEAPPAGDESPDREEAPEEPDNPHGTPDEPLDASPSGSEQLDPATGELIEVDVVTVETSIRVEWRASLYADIGIVAYGEGQMASVGLDLPILPGDGQTVCGQNCRCHLRFDVDDSGDYPTTDIYWETELDNRVCDDCQQMGDDWSPLTVDGAFSDDDVQ